MCHVRTAPPESCACADSENDRALMLSHHVTVTPMPCRVFRRRVSLTQAQAASEPGQPRPRLRRLDSRGTAWRTGGG
eukprot:116084-Rhodomonas_salina.1